MTQRVRHIGAMHEIVSLASVQFSLKIQQNSAQEPLSPLSSPNQAYAYWAA
jgi:hypothetical protein